MLKTQRWDDCIHEYKNGNIVIQYDKDTIKQSKQDQWGTLAEVLDRLDCLPIGEPYCLGNYTMGICIRNLHDSLDYVFAFSDFDKLEAGKAVRLYASPMRTDDNPPEEWEDSMELGNALFGNSRGEYPVPREPFEQIFAAWMSENGFDTYGVPTNDTTEAGWRVQGGDQYFENDTFLLRPYYWGDDEKVDEEPNFIFKLDGLRIDWYKCPLRDAYSNRKLDLNAFRQMLSVCTESLQRREGGRA